MTVYFRWRWMLVLGAVAATGALFPPDGRSPGSSVAGSDEAARRESPKEGRRTADSRQPEPTIGEIRRTGFERGGDAFATRNWTPPPAPPTQAAAPAVPPLPFAFLGKQFEDDAWLVFLGRQDRVYIVREGDSIDGLYRVDAIRPPNIILTYLPINQAQTLSIGEAP